MADASQKVHVVVREVTERIRQRSRGGRAAYLARIDAARQRGSARARLSCTNLAHGFAASEAPDKEALKLMRWPNLAIVSAYDDMLSAHQPFERYPALIKRAAREVGAVAQFAGGVPAMCDGVTQGQPGMVMGALAFGQLPAIFVPGGPMPSGVPNKEKALIRQRHAKGTVDREQLLESETGSYHSAGTCTFYGTANSNQMLMELMGLHLPGAARFQGPRANGMPELHQWTPSLASLQSKGFQGALVTDGRMSGASGSVPAAIHVTPEASSGGPLGRVRGGDIIRLDCHAGVLEQKFRSTSGTNVNRSAFSTCITSTAAVANYSPAFAGVRAMPKRARSP